MQTTTIPDEIVALTEALARELSAWSRAHHGATLAEHEQGVLQIGRRFLGAALGAVVRQAQGLNQPATRRLREACPGCGQRRQPHDPARARQVLTVCGAVHLERPYDYCPACRRGWIPVDERLGLGRRAALSVGASGWAAKAGAGLPFRAAAALLEDLAGVAIGAETVRAHAEGVGRVLAATRQTMAEQVAAEREPVGPVEAAPGLLVLQADGAQLRYIDDWHEVKLGLVAGCQPGEPATAGHPEQAPTLLEPTYVAARAAAAAFGTLWLAEAAQRGALEVLGWEDADGAQATDVRVPALAVLPEVVVLGDGAPWIWTPRQRGLRGRPLAAEHFGRRTEILDWYHASEHLWMLAKALHGESTPATAAWVERAKTLLWEGGATPLRRLLDETQAPTAVAAEVLRLQRGYFTANASRTNYPAYRARGLPIGSGAVESSAKQLVQARMKRAGMRWSTDGGQAILALTEQLANERPLPAVA
jgi:hypothetical protein